MKKKITICLALVLTVVLAISVLTACSLFGGDNKTNNNNNQNGNETKTLTSSECSSELSSAINTSLKKSNYSIKIVGSRSEEMSSYVTTIEHDANTLHYIFNWKKDSSDGNDENNKLYVESYYFVNDGNYYSSVRDSESEDFRTSTSLKATFDTYVASRSLKAIINGYKLNDNAEITYEGTKKGTESSITTTTVATVEGVKTELKTFITIKNGLIVSASQSTTTYNSGDVGTEIERKEITIKYDTATVELAAGIRIA